MLNFLVIMTAVKYPNQLAVITLCVKRELIKGLLELMLAFLHDHQNEVLNQF